MKVGDKVELLHSKDKGIVTRLINSKIAEIKTEDGFILPVNRNDLIVLTPPEPEQKKQKEEEPFTVNPQEIIEHIFDNIDRRAEAYGNKQNKISPPENEVDLHIEQLTDDYKNMSNGEMVNLQLSVFETKLDQAIASGMFEITFIHGVGAGVLRQAIHRVLNQLLQENKIVSFQDGRPYSSIPGCTYVKIS